VHGAAVQVWCGALAVLGLVRADARTAGEDRGDVPGWVLITVMTAGLVIALWAVAGPALTGMFEEAMGSVTGP